MNPQDPDNLTPGWGNPPPPTEPPPPPLSEVEQLALRAKAMRKRLAKGWDGVEDTAAEAILSLMSQSEPYRAGPLRRLVASENARVVLTWAGSEIAKEHQSPTDVIRALLDETTSLIVSIVFNNLGRPNDAATEALVALYTSFGFMLQERLNYSNQLFDEIDRQEAEDLVDQTTETEDGEED